MTRPPKVWAVVVGGGSGQRFGRPKQYESLGAERVIDRSRRIAEACCDGVVVVVPDADVDAERGVAGGATRRDSVAAGLAVVPDDADVICVHDAARPLASAALYADVVAAVLAGADAAVPAVAVADTIKVVDADGVVVSTPERSTLVAVQTPQAFRAEALRRAHATLPPAHAVTDDAGMVEATGGRVVTVPGELGNRKITTVDDLEFVRRQVALESGVGA